MKENITKLAETLKDRNIELIAAPDGAAALETIKSLIPAGASVMNGSSVTLDEIGYLAYLESGAHGWKNWHAIIGAEPDAAKRHHLRREATLADYYLGSVHAIAETGELVIGSGTGSQLPSVVFSSPNVIFVVGVQKIVPTLEEALVRLRGPVFDLEDKKLRDKHGSGTLLGKTVIFDKESTLADRTVRLILVGESLGY